MGCTGNQVLFVPVSPSAEKGSVVYIYRPAKASNVMLTPDMSIAGIETFGIKSGEYKQLYLSPGKHVIRLAATAGNTPAIEHNLEVVKGSVHYLRVDASMKLEFGQSYQPYQRKFELLDVLVEKAATEIMACADMDAREEKRTPMMVINGNEIGGDSDNDEAVFSVDKTANPFSR
jgi:hypothetical protein